MKILFCASECVPFCKTGGLADVVGALAPVLAKEGHDVRVMLPLYSAIPDEYASKMRHVCEFQVDLGWRNQYCGIEALEMDGVTWYFIDNKYYFDRGYIYGLGGDEYERYGFFDRAVLNTLPHIDFKPDVIHCHDWQTGFVPALLKIQYAHLDFYKDIKIVFTIHNLQYQGIFDRKAVQDVLGLGDSLFTDDKLECYGCANFMKAGLVYTDEITTVSPSYAEEITNSYYGERMEGLLRARRDQLAGILNGIDIVTYNPAGDTFTAAKYSADDMSGKALCKSALQKEVGLPVRPDVPVIGMVGRLSNQKGLDLLDCVISQLMDMDVQLVVLGMGDARYVNLFSWAEHQYPQKLAARFAMDNKLAHMIYAGADMFLMPSQFEPCGLSQMMSLRYGTVPVVRETGGLRDTVLSYNEYTGEGNGFTFFNYNAHDMLSTIQRAVYYYFDHQDVWQELMRRGMNGDYSWDKSAQEYVKLYKKLCPPAAESSAEITAAEKPVEKPAEDSKPEKKPSAKKAGAPETEKKPAARKTAAKKTASDAETVKKPAAKKPTAKKAADAHAEKKPVKKKPAKKAEAAEE